MGDGYDMDLDELDPREQVVRRYPCAECGQEHEGWGVYADDGVFEPEGGDCEEEQ